MLIDTRDFLKVHFPGHLFAVAISENWEVCIQLKNKLVVLVNIETGEQTLLKETGHELTKEDLLELAKSALFTRSRYNAAVFAAREKDPELQLSPKSLELELLFNTAQNMITGFLSSN